MGNPPPPEWVGAVGPGAPLWLRELAGELLAPQIEDARTLLSQNGFVVLRAESYRRARERQHIAEAIAKYADERRESTERWAQTRCDEIRLLMDRCTFLYGAARAHGATAAELAGGA